MWSMAIILILLVGSILMVYLPVEFQTIAQILITAGLAGLLYFIFVRKR